MLVGLMLDWRAVGCVALSLVLVSAPAAGPQGDAPFYLYSLMVIFAYLAICWRYRRWPCCLETALMPVVFLSSILVATLVKLSYLGAATPVLIVTTGFRILDLRVHRDRRSWAELAAWVLLPPVVLFLCWGIAMNWSFADFLSYYTGPNIDIVNRYCQRIC